MWDWESLPYVDLIEFPPGTTIQQKDDSAKLGLVFKIAGLCNEHSQCILTIVKWFDRTETQTHSIKLELAS